MLTRRRYPYDRPQIIPSDQWQFACAESGVGGETQSVERAVVPSARHIHLPAGFQPGWIYELVYTAKDPLVHGLGHVAVRDFISFVKYDKSDANPLRGVEKAYAWGRSQTGRCLRDFVYRGFNADAQGAPRVRRRAATCRRRRAQMAEPSLRQSDRLRRPAVRGSLQHRRQFSIFLRVVDRSPDGEAGRHPQTSGYRPVGDPYPDRDGILGAPRLAGAYRHAGQRPQAAGHGAHPALGKFAAFRRSAAARAHAWHRAEFLQRRVNVDVLSRQPRCDGSLGDGWHVAAAKSHSDARRWHVGEHR